MSSLPSTPPPPDPTPSAFPAPGGQGGWVHEHEARLRAIFDAAPVGLVRLSPEGWVERVNGAFAEIVDRPSATLYGASLVDLVLRDDRSVVEEALASVLGGASRREVDARFVHGSPDQPAVPTTLALGRAPGAVDAAPFVVAVVQDQSTHQRLELELRHAQKLEAVGRLAAGIAHEINTPIQFVGDNARFLELAFGKLRALLDQTIAVATSVGGDEAEARLATLSKKGRLAYLDEQVPRAIAQSLDGIERVAAIVQGLKAFARRDGSEAASANLEKALAATLEVARNEIKYHADVETDFGGVPEIWCRVGDLNQVFLNLLVNAAHAIGDANRGEDGARGRIRIRTRLAEDDTSAHVVVSISDTGTGIPEDAQPRLFEPFFTTKEVGRGSGQGLAIAHNIVVEGHGGTLTFETAAGEGTTFHVSLPVGEVPPTRSGAEDDESEDRGLAG